jgi:transcriptional regulator with XRE-family HTH domain
MGMLTVTARVDWIKISEDTHMACLRRRVSLRDIAKAIGVSASGLTRLRQGKHLSADALAALVRWLYPDEPEPSWITSTASSDSRIDMEFP